MRYLGIDVGAKNIGLAVGESLAQELTTLRAKKNASFYDQPDEAYQLISKSLTTEQASAIVVGLPVDESGKPTPESTLIKKFSDGLAQKLNIAVHFVDETLSSFMAEDMLASQGLSDKEAEERIHQLAAQLILQQYLEEHART